MVKIARAVLGGKGAVGTVGSEGTERKERKERKEKVRGGEQEWQAHTP